MKMFGYNSDFVIDLMHLFNGEYGSTFAFERLYKISQDTITLLFCSHTSEKENKGTMYNLLKQKIGMEIWQSRMIMSIYTNQIEGYNSLIDITEKPINAILLKTVAKHFQSNNPQIITDTLDWLVNKSSCIRSSSVKTPAFLRLIMNLFENNIDSIFSTAENIIAELPNANIEQLRAMKSLTLVVMQKPSQNAVADLAHVSICLEKSLSIEPVILNKMKAIFGILIGYYSKDINIMKESISLMGDRMAKQAELFYSFSLAKENGNAII
jgi:hypothetical protein